MHIEEKRLLWNTIYISKKTLLVFNRKFPKSQSMYSAIIYNELFLRIKQKKKSFNLKMLFKKMLQKAINIK